MWALVESNNVTKVYTRPTAITIGENQYPSNIMSVWSAEDLEAIGIYEVVQDDTNYKNPKYYTNTDQSFNFASGTVTASYGTATALPLDDVLWAEDDEDMPEGTSVGDVKQTGIRQGHIDAINVQAGNILQPTDWMVIRATEGGTHFICFSSYGSSLSCNRTRYCCTTFCSSNHHPVCRC